MSGFSAPSPATAATRSTRVHRCGHTPMRTREKATPRIVSIQPDLETLVTAVKAAFPTLRFKHAAIEDRGGDHRLLLLDGEYVFRFPRELDRNLCLEIEVLTALQQICGVPTPRYAFVPPDCAFGGYRFLSGTELTPALFASLDPHVQDRVLDEAVVLLNGLHGLEPGLIAEQHAWRMIWTARQFVERGRQRLPIIDRSFPALAEQISAFYKIYKRDQPPRLVVLHGDLTEDHLLLSERRDSLAGVIDFGDVGLG